MAGLERNWKIADAVTDGAALIATAILFPPALAGLGAELPATVAGIADLFEYLKFAANVVTVGKFAPQVGAESNAMIETFKNASVKVPANKFEDTYSEGFLKTYLTPSGYAGMAGAKTVSILVYDNKTKRSAKFTTGPDESWIVQDKQIVRSKYGSIWKSDPTKPKIDWRL
ncbi:hypothetical protein BBO_03360 [Beauveria brongniartii RCEF 3172]|uniref:Uncharacterized protein n=1 Tax=Beauveria brongniartii RCEF 3172 TaxID=1081107 RepID=A0A167GLS2_9HYPO|nr:hypothetical protein BBO_03360 [Beauveria brongniartii RCEF 3172]